MKQETTTDHLDELLESASAESLDRYLKTQVDHMIASDNAFGEYVKKLIREKKMTQKNVFLGAGIDEKTGYK